MYFSPNCTEDYVSVYDGSSSLSPLIGRFCGMSGSDIVSSGSSLLLIFQSGPGKTPWNYNGFDARVTSKWKSN